MVFLEPLSTKLQAMWVGFIKLLPLLSIAVITLVLTWIVTIIVSKVVKKSMHHTHMRPSLKDFFATISKVAIWILGILISATIVFPNLTPAKLLAGLGLGSVAIGLAFKDIFENFFAGMLVMLRKPMRIGDFIECEGVEGRVEKISMRETYIRKTDDQLILVPNSFIFKNPLYILTDKNLRRFEIIVGVAYGEDVDESREVIAGALANIEEVDKNRAAEIYAREFNSSSIDFTVRWWAQSKPLDEHQSRDKVVTAIKMALDKAGIEIPFPYRTLTFKEPLPIRSEPTENKQEN